LLPFDGRLPREGQPHDEVLAALSAFGDDDADYRDARTFSLVYYLGDRHTDFLKQAFGAYFSENGLNPMAFKSLKRFEAEVVRMSADLLHGDRDAVGVMTSGGTESCLLAVKTYRDWARAKRPWVLRPEMIVPTTIHVAFEKAAAYFGVKAVHAPLGPDFRVDVRKVRRLINRNTILLVGSAPAYPHGVVDPIEELGALAAKKRLPLHVDGCLGGFLLPFVERLGYPVPPFDFRVPGVTSMSADLHKYGYAAKGASVILYRSMDWMRHQLFAYTEWPGGVFASPALLGTRPGGAIAAAWATLMAMGEDGYLGRARAVMQTTRALMDGINAIDGLEVMGAPHMSVFAYRSTDPSLNIFAVGDRMTARGWHVDRNQRPDALHTMITPAHEDIVPGFLSDLAEAVAEVRADPELATKGGAAMYGLISHIPLRGLIKKQVLDMMMALYGPDGQAIDLDARAGADDLVTRAGIWFLKMRERMGL
jgi:sphinganine-1-phosphate aldolase